ncbi:MAG: RsmB/NOP family class I SAM-dependent RNA methyltransferase [Gammaproteobacteria bacterium]|nr:RsmB/NOP family class I SAM-dependent RNA methyltransferase [Gammaproteobacteria bacterium]
MNIIKIVRFLNDVFFEKKSLPPLAMREQLVDGWDFEDKRLTYSVLRHALPLSWFLDIRYPKWRKKIAVQHSAFGICALFVALDQLIFGQKAIYYVNQWLSSALNKDLRVNWLTPIARAILAQAPDESIFWSVIHDAAKKSDSWIAHLLEDNPNLQLELMFSHPPLWISCKSLNLQKEISEIECANILSTDLGGSAIQLKKTTEYVQSLFEAGQISFQNISSQRLRLILEKIEITPNNILDCCAAPGGKSILLFNHYPNANLTLTDLSLPRLLELKSNLIRVGIDNSTVQIEVLQHNWTTSSTLLSNKSAKLKNFDLVLVDPPCSGSGVTRKHPDSLWKKHDNHSLEQTQANILKNAASYVMPGGYLIYSTCSINSNENEKQIGKFISENPSWTYIKVELAGLIQKEFGMLQLMSSSADGMFFAVLQRKIDA